VVQEQQEPTLVREHFPWYAAKQQFVHMFADELVPIIALATERHDTALPHPSFDAPRRTRCIDALRRRERSRNASSTQSVDEGIRRGASNEELVLRLGLRLIRGLSEAHIEPVVRARRDGPFRSFAEFVRRTGLRAAVLKRLSQADAFASLDLDRQSTMWKSLPERGSPTVYDAVDCHEDAADLPPLEPMEEVMADYRAAGLTLRQHPISFLRPTLDTLHVTPSDQLPALDPDVMLSVAGIVMLRQRPGTAKGVTFVTLEDETGTVNLIVHQATWERYRKVARTAVAMIAHGRLQKEKEIIHVLVTGLEDLTERLGELAVKSRDFH